MGIPDHWGEAFGDDVVTAMVEGHPPSRGNLGDPVAAVRPKILANHPRGIGAARATRPA
jgi:hypothetical protein